MWRCWTRKTDLDLSWRVHRGAARHHRRKDRVLKTGVVFCQYPEGVHALEDEDDVARLVIGIAARNNEHIQVITSLTNALDDETVIERLANTTSVDDVLALLNK